MTRAVPRSPRWPIAAVGAWAVAAVLTALAGGVWSVLLTINLTASPAIPWAVAVMAALLWLLWRFLAGTGWPRRAATTRRQLLRARRVPTPVFVRAVTAGLLAIVALSGLWIVLFQLAGLQGRALPDYSQYPLVTVALALLMAALVNAIVEEAVFRGYLQGILEHGAGGVAAILVTTLVMAPEHALTQGFVWPTLVFYAYVDVMLGTTAYLTQSILPGIMIHGIGLLVFFTLVWPGDALRQVVGQGSTDMWLWIHTVQIAIFTALAIAAFIGLARATRDRRVGIDAPQPPMLATVPPALDVTRSQRGE